MTTTHRHTHKEHIMRTLKALALAFALIFGFATAASANGGDGPITIVTPAAPVYQRPYVTYECQYDMWQGHFAVAMFKVRHTGNRTFAVVDTTKRYVSLAVTNNAGDRAVALHGYTKDGYYTKYIIPNYQHRTPKVWVSGMRCQST